MNSIDNDAKIFVDQTKQMVSTSIKVNNPDHKLSDVQLFEMKTKILVSKSDEDVPPPVSFSNSSSGADPVCVNGPCGSGATWPHSQQVFGKKNKTSTPPTTSLIQLEQHLLTKLKNNFIDGFDDQNMEYEDDIERKDQDMQVQEVEKSIVDQDAIQHQFKTNAQLAKMDY
jgi:hypothetical protein